MDSSDDEKVRESFEKMVRNAKLDKDTFPNVENFRTWREDVGHQLARAVDPSAKMGAAVINWVEEVMDPAASMETLMDSSWPQNKNGPNGKPLYRGRHFRGADTILAATLERIIGSSGTFSGPFGGLGRSRAFSGLQVRLGRVLGASMANSRRLLGLNVA